ncbi:hypothetical protein AALD01_01990 [Oscillospiraceae bacterium 21-37]
MRKTQTKYSVLTEKENQLRALTNESENAVSLITNTISRLETVNGRICDTRQEIEDYRKELTRIDSSMEEQFSHNAKIIDKFRSFLED